MQIKKIETILKESAQRGWVLEPDAKKILSLAGITVPKSVVMKVPTDIAIVERKLDYPLVAKIVSPQVIHKSDVKGVVLGITSPEELKTVLQRFTKIKGFVGVIVEEMVKGIELIIGAKNDYQFGPMILLGMGGTGVEIYRDSSLKMAPIGEADIDAMIENLKAKKLLQGYRGADAINLVVLKKLLISFSRMTMKIDKYIESIDLNPVMCNAKACVVADARIMLS